MKASIRIGVMALMVLSIFSGVALADPIPGGGDAGNTIGTASPLESPIPLGSWTVYTNGYLYTVDEDWYQLNTQAGEYLYYDLDSAVLGKVRQQIYNSAGSKIGTDDYGKVLVSGTTYSKDYIIPYTVISANYQFALKRSLT